MAITPEQLAAKGDETSHQKALFCWASLNRSNYPELKWLHSIPNQNSHRMIAEGVRAGVSDVFLPLPIQTSSADQYAGLYIEMKIEKRRKEPLGGCSDAQIEFQEYAKKVGYQTAICYSWIEAKDVILNYLNSAR